jgi:hypothetical protein
MFGGDDTKEYINSIIHLANNNGWGYEFANGYFDGQRFSEKYAAVPAWLVRGGSEYDFGFRKGFDEARV